MCHRHMILIPITVLLSTTVFMSLCKVRRHVWPGFCRTWPTALIQNRDPLLVPNQGMVMPLPEVQVMPYWIGNGPAAPARACTSMYHRWVNPLEMVLFSPV